MEKFDHRVEIDDLFPDERVLEAYRDLILWFAAYANYLVSDVVQLDLASHRC